MPEQADLPLRFPEIDPEMPPLPVRILNEYVYCPRLAYLEWVQGEFADNADTVEGRSSHKRVDRGSKPLRDPADLEAEERIHARSVTLASERLGLIAKLDLVEGDGQAVSPVDYKRGKRPHVEKGAYDPERVQLCAQGLLLGEHGYQVEEGFLYFVSSRERVRVPFDEELKDRTRTAADELRLVAASEHIPPPLEDSPKCPRCSLVGICLPDEVQFLRGNETPPRPLVPAAEEALPLYVQDNRAKVRKRGETLEVHIEDEKQATARLPEVSQVVLFGNASITTPTVQELLRRQIPLSYHTYGGWFLGHTTSTGHNNIEVRTAQFRASFDDTACLRLAKGWVHAKLANCRTLLRRNWRGEQAPDKALRQLKKAMEDAQRADSLDTLLGIEGTGASTYFGEFLNLLKRDEEASLSFDFLGRNRRPPKDPVNAMLSFAYAMLTREWRVALSAVGLDPFRGFFHQPRFGRPALALDMMEPFRPLVADSVVISAVNNGEVRPTDFIHAAGACNLTKEGRKRFIGSFERRLAQEITHPLFGYRITYRRLFEVQARLLSRFFLGEMDDYPNFYTR